MKLYLSTQFGVVITFDFGFSIFSILALDVADCFWTVASHEMIFAWASHEIIGTFLGIFASANCASSFFVISSTLLVRLHLKLTPLEEIF